MYQTFSFCLNLDYEKIHSHVDFVKRLLTNVNDYEK